MIVKAIERVQLKDLVTTLFLVALLLGLLVCTLVRSGSWPDAVKAIKGEYIEFGLPSNPWLDFLPFFLPFLLGFLGFSWLSIAASKNIQVTWLRAAVCVILNLIASLAFATSTTLASIVHFWFNHAIVIGLPPSSPPIWLSTFVSFMLLTANCYRFLVTR